MKTPRALFSIACLLLTGTSLYVANHLWQSWSVSDPWFSFVVLICISSVVLDVTIARRSIFELFLACGHETSAIYCGLIRMCRWRIAHPIYWKFVHYRTILARRRLVIFAALVSFAGLATIVTFLIHPTFAGTAKIMNDVDQPDIDNQHGVIRAY